MLSQRRHAALRALGCGRACGSTRDKHGGLQGRQRQHQGQLGRSVRLSLRLGRTGTLRSGLIRTRGRLLVAHGLHMPLEMVQTAKGLATGAASVWALARVGLHMAVERRTASKLATALFALHSRGAAVGDALVRAGDGAAAKGLVAEAAAVEALARVHHAMLAQRGAVGEAFATLLA